MKLGMIEVSGIRRIVEGRKAVWERYGNRWVKYINDQAIGGKSDFEMYEYLDNKVFDIDIIQGKHERHPIVKNRVWVHGNTINIVKNIRKK